MRIIICLLLTLLKIETAYGQDEYIQQLGAEFILAPESVGLSVGVYYNGKVYHYNFGTTKKGVDQLPTHTTIYEIGSITKTFISTILAHAVIEKKLTLDDDIRRYLPGQYPNLEYEGNPIKIVHLANLTSELPNWLPDKPEIFAQVSPDSIPYVLLRLHENYTQKDFLLDLHSVHLKAAPGTNPKHSNVAAQLLAFILEKVYDRPIQDLVEQYITQPLGMNHTTFVNNQTRPMATGYDAKGRLMPYIKMQNSQAVGGLTSTASDMVKYIKFQADEASEAVKLSHQKTVETPQDVVALNWHITTTETGDRQLWHTGGTFGFSSYIVVYPDQKLGIILMANESDGTMQNKLVQLSKQIVEHLKSNHK
jgi:D-alanyl-D-alanine-carboxypeptidase/D-alanyl-D-alanine-endopeptidase